MVLVATVKVKTRPSGRSLQWCRSRLDNDETRFGQVMANNIASLRDVAGNVAGTCVNI